MITSDQYIGTKICEKCLDRVIMIYTFLEQTKFFKLRLNTCLMSMLIHLKQMGEPTNNVFIEISPNTILPKNEVDFYSVSDIENNSDVDDDDLEVNFLEDEFRIKESSEESDTSEVSVDELLKWDRPHDSDESLQNLARQDIRTYSKRQNIIAKNIDSKDNIPLNDHYVNKTNCIVKYNRRSQFKKLPCPLCNKCFMSEYFLVKHMKMHFNKNLDCDKCAMTFGSKLSLHEHKKMVHLLKKNYCISCRFCSRCFRSEVKLKMHMMSHKNYQCLLCDKLFASQVYYNAHVQRHAYKIQTTKTKTVTCSFCEKEYISKNLLDVHVNKTHLQLKPYNCDMCDKFFYTKYNMINHRLIHMRKSKESCEFCGKTLNSRKKLIVHIRKHIGVKPYKCEICSDCFYSVTERKTHMAKDHGGIYVCKLCVSVFKCKTDLKSHIKNLHINGL